MHIYKLNSCISTTKVNKAQENNELIIKHIQKIGESYSMKLNWNIICDDQIYISYFCTMLTHCNIYENLNLF